MSSAQICTFNVKGLASKTKRDRVLCWLNQQKFSVVLLQEIHFNSNTDDTDKWSSKWNGKCFLSGNCTNSLGAGILISSTCNCKVLEYQEIIVGRMQRIQLEIEERIFNIFNIYAPNNDDVTFFNTLETNIDPFNDQLILVGGDFNTVINHSLDKLNGRNDTNKRTSNKVNELIETFDLCDVFRLLNPEQKLFTWHSNNNPPIFCRLDYFLLSSSALNSVVKYQIKNGYNSDHSVVSMTLNFIQNDKGPGYFKLNNSLLLDTEYQNKIRTSIQEIVSFNEQAPPNIPWEVIKGRIRDETIKYASFKKKTDMQNERDITSKIKELENEIESNATNNILIENLKSEKDKLNQLIDKRIKGVLLRSKAEWIEGSEKNSKYFANLEKKKAEHKIISQLRDNKNNIETNQNNILNQIKDFYQNLYKKDKNIENCDDSTFSCNNVNTLQQNSDDEQSSHLSEYECGIALREMKNNKSPGSDGITADFYKIF